MVPAFDKIDETSIKFDRWQLNLAQELQ